MKKNRTMRVAVLMLALTLLTCCFVGSTFARYTSSANGSNSVTVAKWAIGVLDETTADATVVNITGTDSITFDLFNTINDTDGSEETDVADELIAPGTQGAFSFTITNNSEVTAQYKLDYTVTNEDNIPVVFSVDGGNTWAALADVDFSDATKLAMTGDDKSETITVQWKWVIDGDNAADTALGVKAADDRQTTPSITVKLDLTVQQVD